MERIVLDRLNQNNLLPPSQFGFRKDHYMIDQVFYYGQKIRDAHNIRPANQRVAAFLDLSNVSDRVRKYKLFSTFNIRRILPWLADFLRASDRVVVHQASTPQVRVLFPGWARSTQPFIPTAVGR
ncbi:putative RNA-directed DNA polymerase from transposon BS [Trichonephila clavipes]|nr:putative RNA-directed DNA polymerase from transposon BS [Trichonephila clavipes]